MNDMVERLKEAIAVLNATQNAFASKANIDPSNFGKMLEGKQKIPDRSMVQFKIVNLDNGKVYVYEHQKGKGF